MRRCGAEIRAVRPGAHLGDIGHAIQNVWRGSSFLGRARFGGHGIGRQSTRTRRCCITGRPGTGLDLAGRDGLHHRADDQLRARGDSRARRRLDYRHGGFTRCPRSGNIRFVVTADGCEVLTTSPGMPRHRPDALRHRPARRCHDRPDPRPIAPPPLPRPSAGARNLAPCGARSALRFHARPDTREAPARAARAVDRVLIAVWSGLAAPRDIDTGRGGRLWAVGSSSRIPTSTCCSCCRRRSTRRRPLFVERFIGTLWDIGVEIAHSVRTIAECEAELATDITIRTSLLEQPVRGGRARVASAFDTPSRRRWTRAPSTRRRCSSSSSGT